MRVPVGIQEYPQESCDNVEKLAESRGSVFFESGRDLNNGPHPHPGRHCCCTYVRKDASKAYSRAPLLATEECTPVPAAPAAPAADSICAAMDSAANSSLRFGR